MRRLIAALLTLLTVSAIGLVVAEPAHATVGYQWYVHYGEGYTSNSPNVWSNRSPTWVVGTDPQLTLQPTGDLMDFGSFCPPSNLCWHTGVPAGPGPWQAYWDSRANTSGKFSLYSSNGVIRFTTNTGGWIYAQMVLFNNGCLNVYGRDVIWYEWGYPIWRNSSNPACGISLGA